MSSVKNRVAKINAPRVTQNSSTEIDNNEYTARINKISYNGFSAIVTSKNDGKTTLEYKQEKVVFFNMNIPLSEKNNKPNYSKPTSDENKNFLEEDQIKKEEFINFWKDTSEKQKDERQKCGKWELKNCIPSDNSYWLPGLFIGDIITYSRINEYNYFEQGFKRNTLNREGPEQEYVKLFKDQWDQIDNDKKNRKQPVNGKYDLKNVPNFDVVKIIKYKKKNDKKNIKSVTNNTFVGIKLAFVTEEPVIIEKKSNIFIIENNNKYYIKTVIRNDSKIEIYEENNKDSNKNSKNRYTDNRINIDPKYCKYVYEQKIDNVSDILSKYHISKLSEPNIYFGYDSEFVRHTYIKELKFENMDNTFIELNELEDNNFVDKSQIIFIKYIKEKLKIIPSITKIREDFYKNDFLLGKRSVDYIFYNKYYTISDDKISNLNSDDKINLLKLNIYLCYKSNIEDIKEYLKKNDDLYDNLRGIMHIIKYTNTHIRNALPLLYTVGKKIYNSISCNTNEKTGKTNEQTDKTNEQTGKKNEQTCKKNEQTGIFYKDIDTTYITEIKNKNMTLKKSTDDNTILKIVNKDKNVLLLLFLFRKNDKQTMIDDKTFLHKFDKKILEGNNIELINKIKENILPILQQLQIIHNIHNLQIDDYIKFKWDKKTGNESGYIQNIIYIEKDNKNREAFNFNLNDLNNFSIDTILTIENNEKVLLLNKNFIKINYNENNSSRYFELKRLYPNREIKEFYTLSDNIKLSYLKILFIYVYYFSIFKDNLNFWIFPENTYYPPNNKRGSNYKNYIEGSKKVKSYVNMMNKAIKNMKQRGIGSKWAGIFNKERQKHLNGNSVMSLSHKNKASPKINSPINKARILTTNIFKRNDNKKESESEKYSTYLRNLKKMGVEIISTGHKPHCAPVPLIYKRFTQDSIIFIANDLTNGYRNANIVQINQIPLSYAEIDNNKDLLYVGVGMFNDTTLTNPNFNRKINSGSIFNKIRVNSQFTDSIKEYKVMVNKWKINNVPLFDNNDINYITEDKKYKLTFPGKNPTPENNKTIENKNKITSFTKSQIKEVKEVK